jgi:membrane protease YdiL (CAAX protease family)
MNHLESAFKGKNDFWRYLVMIAAVFLASNTVGAIPLIIALAMAVVHNPDVATQLAQNPSDYSVLGLDPYTGLSFMLFPFLVALLAFFLLIRPLNNRTFKMTINGTNRFRWSHFLISFLVWLVISGIYLFVYLKVEPSNFRINNTGISLLFISLLALLLIPFQAAFEEVVFRGYLMQGFALTLKNRWFPLLMTSVLFGLMHSLNPEVKEFGFISMMPQYMLFGLIFGLVTIFDDGIEAAIGAHSANNIFLIIMVTSKSSALQTPALFEQTKVFPGIEFSGLLISGVAFILILKGIFRWKDLNVVANPVREKSEVIESNVID